jgi:hypothetical protein
MTPQAVRNVKILELCVGMVAQPSPVFKLNL